MEKHIKEIKYIQSIIKLLELKLDGLTVLTEIGSSYYFYLPFIAALAGAKKVTAWTGTNNYFDCEELIEEAVELIAELNLTGIIEFSINQKSVKHIQEADIITNSGFLRPLDKNFLKHCKSNVAISLMFEAWELRHTDIDISYCKENKIRVAGIWESHPKLAIFESVGHLAIKLAMEAGHEIYQNQIIIWSNDDFGTITEDYFNKLNPNKVIRTTDRSVVLQNLPETDFIYFCSNHEKRTILGYQDDALFNPEELKALNPTISIVHLYGQFDLKDVQNQLHVYPFQDGKCEYMSKTLTYLGMKPTLNLLIGGLKVGQEVFYDQRTNLTQMIHYD